MENMAFHSLLRLKIDYATISYWLNWEKSEVHLSSLGINGLNMDWDRPECPKKAEV